MKKVNFYINKVQFWGLGGVWVPGWNQGSKKGGKVQLASPLLGRKSVVWSVIVHVFSGAPFLDTLSPFGAQRCLNGRF